MEDAIKGIVPHILSFVINELCKNAFKIAYEKELSDLKGLIDPDSISPDDFELLEAVSDPVVQVLLKSVDKVIRCSKTYFMINGLDEMEVMEDEEYNILASDSYYAYIIEWESNTYEDMVQNLNAVYFSISQLLYHTACQIRLNDVEIPDDMYDEFLEQYSDLLMHKMFSDDKNITLLYDLIIELNEDLLEIDGMSDRGRA